MSTNYKTDFNISKFTLPGNEVEEYVNSVKSKAETLIFNEFPEKILRFNRIIEASDFKNKPLKDIHQEVNIPVPKPILLQNIKNKPSAKRLRYDNVKLTKNIKFGTDGVKSIPINKHVVDLVALIKPHIKELIEDMNLLKMWISLLIPKIEDGNNFGVSVQAAVLAEIRSVETGTASFFEEISKYYVSRGKLISKVRKYPHLGDYRQAVEEIDEKEFLNLWLMMIEIRNYYCSLHDVVTKNYDKIKKPRITNACESLY